VQEVVAALAVAAAHVQQAEAASRPVDQPPK
jgi:hypothetical protein